jgi:hypothetical protein
MIQAGILVVIKEEKGTAMHPNPYDWLALSGGVLLLLYTFMADALKVLPADTQTLNSLRPTQFNWLVFLLGLGLAGVFVWRLVKSKLEEVR